jgi:type I restriction enzyme R subunit
VSEGFEELDQDKLAPLLQLKYRALSDAVLELGPAQEIGKMFVGFQQYLY